MSNSSPSRYRWYVLSLTIAVNLFVNAMPLACMPVLLKEIGEDLGLSLVQVGTIWGASSGAGIFIMLFGGLLGDRFGVRSTVTIACLMAGVFGALRGLSGSFTSLLATSIFFGLAIQVIHVNASKTASLWFHGRQLGMAQGAVSAGVGGGFIVGIMLSATILSPLLGGWRHVLFLYGAVSLLFCLLWFLTVREPTQTEVKDAVITVPLRQALSRVVHVKSVWLIAVAMMGFAGCTQGLMGYLPIYLRDHGWTPASADGALASFSAAGTAAVVPLLILSDRLGLRKAIILPGMAIFAIGIGLLSVVTSPLAWVLVVMVGLFHDTCWATALTMAIETKGVGPVYAGTAAGLVLTFSRLGFAFSPPLGNSLATIHPGLPLVLWAGMAAVGAFILLFVAETGQGKKRSYAIEY